LFYGTQIYTPFYRAFCSTKWALFEENSWDLTIASALNEQNFTLFTVDVAAFQFQYRSMY